MAHALKNHSKISKTALWPQHFLRLQRAKRGFALGPPGIGYPGRHHHTRRPGPPVTTPGLARLGGWGGTGPPRSEFDRCGERALRCAAPQAAAAPAHTFGSFAHPPRAQNDEKKENIEKNPKSKIRRKIRKINKFKNIRKIQKK